MLHPWPCHVDGLSIPTSITEHRHHQFADWGWPVVKFLSVHCQSAASPTPRVEFAVEALSR